MDIEVIKAAIRKHRGGWEQVEDPEAFWRLWQSLPESTRAEYLAALEPAATPTTPTTPAPPETT